MEKHTQPARAKRCTCLEHSNNALADGVARLGTARLGGTRTLHSSERVVAKLITLFQAFVGVRSNI